MDKQQLLEKLRTEFSEHIVNVFEKVKREDFVDNSFKDKAYEDIPLPISNGQTISQPYTIAFMLELLELDRLKCNNKNKTLEGNKKNLKILEIGSGSGYVLALINKLCDSQIYGIERIPELCELSRERLKDKKNIHLFCRDGSKGFKEEAPFDRILVSASASQVPGHLYRQLKDNGIIVASVRNSIFKIKKEKGRIKVEEFPGFVFVPLIE